MGQFITQIDRAAARYLNNVNDAAPGQSLASPSGSLIVGFDGQVGAKYAVTGMAAGSISSARSPTSGSG